MQFYDCAELGGVLEPVTAENCDVILQQVRRSAFQRIQATPSFTNTTIATKATWDPLLAETDETLIVAPPKAFYSPEFTPTEPVKIGSNDNTTPNGKSIIVGESVPMLRYQYNGLTPTQFGQINKLFAEANATMDFSTLWQYLFLGENQIVFAEGGGGLPIVSAFISSPTGGQLHTLTLFQVEIELEKNWYEGAKILTLPYRHALIKN